MKILLVSERDELKSYIRRNFMPRGAEIIQYYNPIKAMDNLDELEIIDVANATATLTPGVTAVTPTSTPSPSCPCS